MIDSDANAATESVDDKVKQADQERGIIILLKGNGKGKNSSAFGMGARLYPAA